MVAQLLHDKHENVKTNTKMQKIKRLFKIFSLVVPVSMLTSSCERAPANSTTTVPVLLMWQGQPWSCGQPITLGGQAMQLDLLQLYLSEFSQQSPLSLKPSANSTDSAVLLGVDCHAPAQSARWEIALTRPLVDGPLHFTLGLPSALNHQNPLTAASAFQAADMHWSWQFGYKFLRIDLAAASATGSPWSFHLGSTGCDAPSVMRAPSIECQAPNRVALSVHYHAGQPLILDLAPLLADFTPTADNSCMSDPQVASCQLLLGRLGLLPQHKAVPLFAVKAPVAQSEGAASSHYSSANTGLM